jgi:hypothetical protein
MLCDINGSCLYVEEYINVNNAVFCLWRRVDLVNWTEVSEGRIASIFRVEKSASEEPARAGGCIHTLTWFVQKLVSWWFILASPYQEIITSRKNIVKFSLIVSEWEIWNPQLCGSGSRISTLRWEHEFWKENATFGWPDCAWASDTANVYLYISRQNQSYLIL